MFETYVAVKLKIMNLQENIGGTLLVAQLVEALR